MQPRGHAQNSEFCFTCARRLQVKSEQRSALICNLHVSADCLDLVETTDERGQGEQGRDRRKSENRGSC